MFKEHSYQPILNEEEAAQWILSSPAAFCNTTDGNILRQILPSFDQETTDFFRWTVRYSTEELSELIAKNQDLIWNDSFVDAGETRSFGKNYSIENCWNQENTYCWKELEIRRWLSKSHLYSSAFIVQKENDTFILRGAGWDTESVFARLVRQ